MSNTQTPPKGLTIIVAMMSMIGPFTVDTYLPSFPAMEAEFGISRAVLSQSLALYLAAFAVFTLILGPLADKLGRQIITLLPGVRQRRFLPVTHANGCGNDCRCLDNWITCTPMACR